MTRQHFTRAAEIVRAIRDGDWTNDAPSWAQGLPYWPEQSASDADYARAVQTAEAFIALFSEFNSGFNQTRFLKACGLVED